MIHFARGGRLEAYCGDPAAVLITDDRRQVTCGTCLELTPSRLAKAAAVAYARKDGRLRVRRVIRVPVGVISAVEPEA